LIGNRNGRDIVGRGRGSDNLLGDLELCVPNLESVVFNPTGLWKVLLELELRRVNAITIRIEQNCA